ncbi:MAG: hypothetical protein NZL95_02795 [Chitinophagales bacterium]|nr:hypothetical protein [Chitinophagales bacterium]MDW8427459.1 hypothetical protein [Chitinophagales bacterium]
MLRRIIAGGLLLIFIAASVGVVHVHYTCQMTPQSMVQDKNCCEDGLEECCSVEVFLLKVKDNFLSSSEKKLQVPATLWSASLLLAEWLSSRAHALLETGFQQLERVTAQRVLEVWNCCFLI